MDPWTLYGLTALGIAIYAIINVYINWIPPEGVDKYPWRKKKQDKDEAK